VLATIIIDLIALGNTPNASLIKSSALLITGALIAGWETLSVDAFGYMIIWCNNFAQAVQNVAASKLNKDNLITAFDMNFFFSLIGLPLSFFIICYSGEMQTLI
jgi:hypothetical protein